VISECLVRAPRDANCLLIQAALQGRRGDIEAAQLTMANLVTAQPTFSLEAERSYRRFGNKPLMEQFLNDLTVAKAPGAA
jgi:adenylate cyclase